MSKSNDKQLQVRHGKSQVNNGKVTKITGQRVLSKGQIDHFKDEQDIDSEVVMVVSGNSKISATIYAENKGEDLGPNNGKLGKGYNPSNYTHAITGDPNEFTQKGYEDKTNDPEFLKRISAVIDITPVVSGSNKPKKAKSK